MPVSPSQKPARRKATRVRTALTAAAIIAGGVVAGTLIALTPLLDETSSFELPRLQKSSDARGMSRIAVPPFTVSPRHEPQPHLMHGVRHAGRAYQPTYVNL